MNKLERVAYRAMHTSYVICRNGVRVRQSAEVSLLHLKSGYFFLQKHMDLLQEAFIQAPEPREARFIMDARAFFFFFI